MITWDYMRSYYVTIIGMAPEVRESFRERMQTKEGRWALADYFFEKIRPVVAKRFGEEGVDYESAVGVEVMPGQEFVEMLNPDTSLPFISRIPTDYIFDEWLDSGSVWRDSESFASELEKLQNTMLLFFSVDV